MRILHYSLGFPPYRTGGLTKFCMDLMNEQTKEGNEVALLWPGRIKIFSRKVSIKKGDTINGIDSLEIINPLPVPFDEGIKDFDSFMQDGEESVFDQLFNELKPDVVHIHTLMGLHKSLLTAAKKKNIRLIFTTHDFFPICPKVTMFCNGKVCEFVESCKECGKCNVTALSSKKLFLLQSPLYRKLKNSVVVKVFRRHHRDSFLSNESNSKVIGTVGKSDDYKRLRNYYQKMLALMDVIHYNSYVTKKVYESIFVIPNGKIVSITHSDISDNRRLKKFSEDCIRIRYLGPQGGAKGYYLLKSALDMLWKKKQNFSLDIHFTPFEMSPYMNVHDKYEYSELERIFDDTDVLVAPSVLYETFGFTVLEAISYGVPVIVSGNVGAKEIIADGAGVIVDDINAEKLFEVFFKITNSADLLKQMNEIIIKKQSLLTIANMSERIYSELYI